MKEIKIFEEAPVILTKDKDFLKECAKIMGCVKPGTVILIPDDAVLISPSAKIINNKDNKNERSNNNNKQSNKR